MITQKRPFWVGAIVWKDFTDHALQVKKFEDQLNEKLCLSNYGPAITSFNYIPMVLSPANRIHEEEFSYDPKKKETNIHIKLDYQIVINTGLDGFLTLVGKALLDGIEILAKKDIVPFDWPRFVKDVEQLLAENGWLLRAERA